MDHLQVEKQLLDLEGKVSLAGVQNKNSAGSLGTQRNLDNGKQTTHQRVT